MGVLKFHIMKSEVFSLSLERASTLDVNIKFLKILCIGWSTLIYSYLGDVFVILLLKRQKTMENMYFT